MKYIFLLAFFGGIHGIRVYGNSYCLAILFCTIEQKKGISGIRKFFGAYFTKNDEMMVGIFGNCQPSIFILNKLKWKLSFCTDACLIFFKILFWYKYIFHLRLLQLNLLKIAELSPLPIWMWEIKKESKLRAEMWCK